MQNGTKLDSCVKIVAQVGKITHRDAHTHTHTHTHTHSHTYTYGDVRILG